MNNGWHTVNTRPPQGKIVWLYCRVHGSKNVFQTSGYYKDTIWYDWCGDTIEDDELQVKYWRDLPPDPNPKTITALDKLESRVLSDEERDKMVEAINSEMVKITKEYNRKAAASEDIARNIIINT